MSEEVSDVSDDPTVLVADVECAEPFVMHAVTFCDQAWQLEHV